MQVSIIIPVKNEGAHILNTVNGMLQAPNNTSYEIIVVDDNSTDGCCHPLRSSAYSGQIVLLRTTGIGLARAKNLGAKYARGEILLFCDGHLLVPPYWIDQLISPLQEQTAVAVSPGIAQHTDPNSVGYGQTWTAALTISWLAHPKQVTPVPLLPGGCMAIQSAAFQKIKGFDPGFRVWGYEDQEISLNLWLQGYTLSVNPFVTIQHVFRSSFPYPVEANQVNYNLLRLAYTHFNSLRIQKTLDLLGQKGVNQPAIIQQVESSGVFERHQCFLSSRVYDDDWFFERFQIPF